MLNRTVVLAAAIAGFIFLDPNARGGVKAVLPSPAGEPGPVAVLLNAVDAPQKQGNAVEADDDDEKTEKVVKLVKHDKEEKEDDDEKEDKEDHDAKGWKAAEKEIKQAVPLNMVPASVMDAVKKEVPNGSVTEAELQARKGKIMWAFDVKDGAIAYDIKITVDGKFYSKKVDDEKDEQEQEKSKPTEKPVPMEKK